jgi:putative ABC transport system substrate-binding protein
MTSRGFWRVAWAVCFFALPVSAARVATLTDGKVAQYREALEAAKSQLKGSETQDIDLGGGNAESALKGADPAVILAIGQKALQAAQDALPNTPTVYCLVFQHLAPNSRSVTGVPLEVSSSDQLNRIKQLFPSLKRIGVFYDRRSNGLFIDEAQRVARSLGLSIVPREVSDPKEVRAAAADLAANVDALWLLPDARLITKEVFSYLLIFTLEHKVALIGFLDAFTQAGALASISPDYKDMGRRAGELAAEIAAKPADKRVPVPDLAQSPGTLTVNLKTAGQLGITVSAASTKLAKQVFQ